MIIAVDPGYEQSAYVVYEPLTKRIVAHNIIPNDTMLALLRNSTDADGQLVLEQIASFGMPVGEEIFETVFWTGRFAQAWCGSFHRMKRIAVKTQLCKNARANDTHVRQALIDYFGPGKDRAIGVAAAPGPLYKIKADEWQALAVAVAWVETHQ